MLALALAVVVVVVVAVVAVVVVVVVVVAVVGDGKTSDYVSRSCACQAGLMHAHIGGGGRGTLLHRSCVARHPASPLARGAEGLRATRQTYQPPVGGCLLCGSVHALWVGTCWCMRVRVRV